MAGTGRHQRVGLVLGAGGTVGHAFETGVLAAIAERTGWEPNDAEVIVGTSAGSVVGALTRAGLSAADQAARITRDPLSAAGRRLFGSAPPPQPVPRPAPVRDFSMAAPEMLLSLASRPWDVRPGKVASALLPAGRVVQGLDVLTRLYGDVTWPSAALWLCTVRLRDGRRVILGREGAPRCPVGDAVAASCAIPGWFAPVVIAGERHVDGGAHSVTNLDVLAGYGLDLVIVVSPTSVESGLRSATLDVMMRRTAGLVLAQERRRVQARGTAVTVIEPAADDLEVMGPISAAMNPERRAAVTRRARETTLQRLDRGPLRAAVAPLHG